MDSQYSSNPRYQTVERRNPWTTGILARMPWLGLGALLGALAGLAASAAIIVYSDGQPIAYWTYQPAIYLAIASVLTNICLFYALKEAVNIAWWQKAMSTHTIISDLHRFWSFGTTFTEATLSGKHFNLVALACILATIAQINSPLLQRASKAVVEPVNTQSTVRLRLAPDLPYGYTGYTSGRGHDVSLFTADFSQVVQSYNTNGTIGISDTGCQGMCSTTVSGMGLALNCSRYTLPFDLNPQKQPDGTYDVSKDPSVNGTDVFQSLFPWSSSVPGNISIDVVYKGTSECSGVLMVQNCTMHPAKVLYKVLIDGNQSTIALDPSTTIFDDQVLALLNYPTVSTSAGPTTLGGFWLALSNKLQSTAHMRFVGAVGYEIITTGNTATQYAVVNGTAADGTTVVSPGTTCSTSFRDPMNDIIASVRDLMFRTSIAAANSSTPLQSVLATETGQRAVFRSNYAYLGGALGVTILPMLVIASLLKGYHSLGRKTTINPIEIAKAFNAPMLRGGDSNATIGALMKELGDRSVRYGAVPVGAMDGEYGNGAPNGGYRSKYASSTTTHSTADGEPRMRLEMADEGSILEPRSGWKFVG